MSTFNTQNTVTFAMRHKYFQSGLQQALRNSLVSSAVFKKDTSELRTIENPYISSGGTITQQTLTGTYSVSALATTEDTLSVTEEIVVPTHVFDFEQVTANFDIMAEFLEDLIYRVNYQVDYYVINKITSLATGTYTTPAGGFTQAANVAVIMSNLLSKIEGYNGVGDNPFLIIENTDIVGFAQAQVASGFSYADAALRNGMMTNYMGVEIYVIRTGTFATATIGTLSATNSGHRLFGIKNNALFASPRGVQYTEKEVSGKLGKEVVAWSYVGATIWTPFRGLFVNITLA